MTRDRSKNSIYGGHLLILKFNRHNSKMSKANIHYLYNKKVTNKKLRLLRVFHILKPLHYNFIINTTRNVFPYAYNQVVIHLLITHSTTQSIIHNLHS